MNAIDRRDTGTRVRRIALAASLAVASLASAAIVPAAAPSARAVEGVVVTGETTLTVRPQRGVIRAVVDLRIRNERPSTTANGVTTDWLVQEWSIAVPDEAQAIRVTRGGRRLPTTVRERDGYDLVQFDLRPDVRFRQNADVRVTYDLPDGGARSESPIRIGRAYLSFYAFAHGDDRATVRIVVPPGFELQTRGGPITQTATDDGGTVLTTDGSVDDLRWYVLVAGDRPSELEVESLTVDVDGQPRALQIRSWPEDAFWAKRVRDRLTRGLVALHELHGLDWPVDGPLRVTESATDSLEGYAGFYDQGERGDLDEILMSEEPDELVIVHEAAHAWFNDGLFSGRWISEGLADAYAARALVELGEKARPADPAYRDTPVAFALNLWAPPERIESAAAQAREAYGYDAARQVFDELLDEIGEARMREVLAAAAAETIAFTGRPAPERQTLVADFHDWRYLLDLLEQVGGSKRAGQLFETWIASDVELPLLDDHVQSVRRYQRIREVAGEWLPGHALRVALARWDFEVIDRELELADTVLDRRAVIERQATQLGLSDGGVLRDAFEGAVGSYESVLGLADDQLETLGTVAGARAAVAGERSPLTAIGLLGVDTDTDLVEAADAYGQGRLADARAEAAEAVALIDGAEAEGQRRAAVGGIGLVAVVFLVGGGWLVARRRRALQPASDAVAIAAGPPDATPAAPSEAASAGQEGPATLAARPEAAGRDEAATRDEGEA